MTEVKITKAYAHDNFFDGSFGTVDKTLEVNRPGQLVITKITLEDNLMVHVELTKHGKNFKFSTPATNFKLLIPLGK